ncbi:MAG: hypothetical protein MUO40_06270 [Anaerolineaceae bacterium]|nr:hypothetical protein [Anaerolineaceae bacterium]
MTLKIKLNHIILGLAVIMFMLSTNAVVIAQVGESENGLPGTISKATAPEQRAPMVVPGGPGHVMLTAFDFQPRSMDTQWAYADGLELYNPGIGQGIYIAPVHLPDGATVKQVVLYYYDDVEENLNLSLSRSEAGGGIIESMAVIIPTGTGGYSYDYDSIISYAQIDLANYSYYLGLLLKGGAGDKLTLLQVRIDYDYPTFLPTVLK